MKPFNKQWTIAIRPFFIVLALVAFAGIVPSATAQITVGGHIGMVIPWVTHGGGQTTTQFDEYNIGFPIGVTFKGQGHFAVDLETIPFVTQNKFSHSVNFVVDPGILYSL